MRNEEKQGLSNFAWDIFKTSGNIESYLLYNEIHSDGEKAGVIDKKVLVIRMELDAFDPMFFEHL